MSHSEEDTFNKLQRGTTFDELLTKFVMWQISMDWTKHTIGGQQLLHVQYVEMHGWSWQEFYDEWSKPKTVRVK
jgi:hypothetical protein